MVASTTKRAQRIHAGAKVAVWKVAVSRHGVKRPSQLVAAERALKKLRGETADDCISASTARGFAKSNMLVYREAQLKTFRNDKHAGICCDAVRCAGEDILGTALWSPEKRMAAWLAPAVGTARQRDRRAVRCMSTEPPRMAGNCPKKCTFETSPPHLRTH